MKRRGTVLAKGFKVIGSGVAFVAGKAVLGINGVPFFHANVAMSFRKDRGSGDGNASRIALDKGFLFDENIELHGVDEQIVRLDGKLLESGGHRLAAGLINVPGVDALGVDFRDGPRDGVFTNTSGQLGAALGGKFLRIVETDNAPLGIENHRGGDNGTEERAATGFVETGDAHPAKLSRRSLETGGAEAAHCAEILARAELRRSLISQRHDRIDLGRALSRQVCRKRRYRTKKKTGAGKRQRVRGSYLEQHPCEQAV